MLHSIESVDEYIKAFPPAVQKRLKLIRKVILDKSPLIAESISYGMPAYKLYKKPLVYFAAYDKHIGFYATPTGHDKFKKQLAAYKQGKGSVQFPHDLEFPISLIEEIVLFRISENELKAKK